MSALKRLGIALSAAQSEKAHSETQRQTKDTFGFKWSKRDTYDSETTKKNTRQWLVERYCWGDPSRLAVWLAGGRKIILDAGCGAGYSALLLFGDLLKEHDYLGWTSQMRRMSQNRGLTRPDVPVIS